MRSVLALRALWFAIRAPWRLHETTTRAAAATFALAVLLGSFAASGVQMWEHSDPQLVKESQQFAVVTGTTAAPAPAAPTAPPAALAPAALAPATPIASTDVVTLDSPARQFTALLGNNLLVFVLSIVISSGVYMLLGRFLTSEQYTFSMAFVCVSATTSIAIIGTVLTSAIHIAMHSMRFGMNAGIGVDPLQSPFLYLWLQRIDVFGVWQALATGVGLTTWVGLDRKYGYVVGAVVWLTVLLVFFGVSSIVSWILAQGLTR
ncbi:MAG: hypothetical protein SGJ05_01200 [bacterium]|nr:hypothetical protein [bacterium]